MEDIATFYGKVIDAMNNHKFEGIETPIYTIEETESTLNVIEESTSKKLMYSGGTREQRWQNFIWTTLTETFHHLLDLKKNIK